MPPKLCGIDHAHVYVSDRAKAEAWYRETLGFKRVRKLDAWATKMGPLTMEDAGETVHLALFEDDTRPPLTSLAFGTTGPGFMDWKAHLEGQGLTLRIADHQLAYSLYFHDPWDNYHEITTYDRDFVAEQLNA